MTKVAQIRKEFNEPFKDVIEGFAIMGYSKKSTAEILEINRSYFTKNLLPRYAPNAPWKARIDLRDDCKPKGKGWPKGKHRYKPLKYSDEELLALVNKYKTAQEFDNKAEPCVDTVIKRFGSWKRARSFSKIFVLI